MPLPEREGRLMDDLKFFLDEVIGSRGEDEEEDEE